MTLMRAGIPACFSRFSASAVGAGAALLVSANAFFKHKRKEFRYPAPDLFHGADVALDSAGFVAMFRYGGYPWTVEQYIGLAASYPWAWYASMDFCCEPQIAPDRAEVRRRVQRTIDTLAVVRAAAAAEGIKSPMPVLQGWLPSDYEWCVKNTPRMPDLVGVGSICRRPLNGSAGVLAVLDRLDKVLPPHVRLHLFGVKGSVAVAINGHPRVESLDSMAWDFRARKVAHEKGISNTVEHRAQHLVSWINRHGPARSRYGVFA